MARMGERRFVCRVLVGKSEGKRPLGRRRLRWEGILRLIFRKWDGSMGWIDLAQDRDRRRIHVLVVMNLRVP